MSVRSRFLVLSVTALALTGQALATVPVSADPASAAAAQDRATSTTQVWGPVKTLARNPRGEALVVDARNNTTIVWATSSTPPSIVALRRPAGAHWRKPVVIGHGYAPRVAADARGNVTVAWLSQRRGRTDGVVAARRPVRGRWSVPVRLSHDLSVPGYPQDGEDVYGAAEVDLAVSPKGAVVVAWDWGSDDRDKPWRIQSAYRPPGGPWRKPVDVTPASGAKQPQVGIAADGTAALVYARQRAGHPQALKSRRRLVDSGWTRPVPVAAEGYNPALAVDRTGNAVVVFTPDFTKVEAVRRSAAGPWGPARTLSPAGVEISDFALAANGPGAAVVALARGSGRIDLVRRPPRGPWSPPVRVVHAGSVVYDVLVALNGAGDTFLGWGGYALYGKYRPHGGGWSARSTVSPDTGVDVLEATFGEVAPNGDVAVMWEQEARPLKVRWMYAS